MNLKKLSVKNFIGDLPRIINESLDAIQTAFDKVYHEDTNTIGDNSISIECKSVKATGNEQGNGIVSYSDIKLIRSGETISIEDMYERLRRLEETVNPTMYGKSVLVKKKLQ